ncbi:unnamed protein product [Brassica rapa]|uniref:Uncharacterized protein n=2 Tax=Brassica TaxID=3705 RepID=A0A8D9H6D4_BRACM|nr:unnamed protein product [Brassica napus]CAG7892614.1 unnamed protein product [Brassica rapa]
MRHPDFTIHLTQVLNPWSSESSPKTITLPPFTGHLVLHAEIVGNVSLSTYLPNQDDDYIVSFTFFGSKLCYCMPNRDSNWTIINIYFSCEINSSIIYPRKDQFSTSSLQDVPTYMAALDLKKNKKNPKFMRFQFGDFPLIPQYISKISILPTQYQLILPFVKIF